MTAPAPTPLWEELRAIVRMALQVFGEPARLLEDLVLPRDEARRLASWLGALEAAARALLVALALGLPVAAAMTRASAARRRETAGNNPMTDEKLDAAPEETPDSERWAGVAFRMAPRVRRSGSRGGRAGPRRFLYVRGLAYRLEALVRVAAAPDAYARRLARRLHAEPGLAVRVLREPQDRGRPPPYAELVEDALAAARSALGPPAPETG